MNTFRVITITHKTANINHIGRYVPSVYADATKLASKLHEVKEVLAIDELMYLVTCNRILFFFTGKQVVDQQFAVKLFQALDPHIPEHCLDGLKDVVTTYNGLDCIQHLFEVASSLDSLVIGEREILRQLRTAYEFSRKQKLTGDSIRLAMKMAIPTAKQVYTQTKIGENCVSVVSLAMQQLLKQNLDQKTRFLIVGAGQTNNLVAKFLLKYNFTNFVVFNRSIANAQLLADKLNGEAHSLDQLANYQQPFDVMITCTGATEPIITKEIYARLLNGDTSSKTIIDLAVPNDVDASVVQNYDVRYIEVEHLRELAAQNLDLRKQEAFRAKKIISERVNEFKILMRQRKVERAMSQIPREVKQIKSRAMQSVFHKEIAALDPGAQETLERIISYMEKKYISIPMRMARNVLEKELRAQQA